MPAQSDRSVRAGGPLTVSGARVRGRSRNWWVVGGILLGLLVLASAFGVALGDDSDPVDLTTAIAARTERGDTVGVVEGVDRAVVPPDRRSVVVDATTPAAEIPDLVVVSDAMSDDVRARFLPDPGAASPVSTPDARYWLVTSDEVAAAVSDDETGDDETGEPSTTTSPLVVGPTTSPDPSTVEPSPTTTAPPSTTAAPTTTAPTTTAPTTTTAPAAEPSAPDDPAASPPAPDRDPATDRAPTAERFEPGTSLEVAEGEHFWHIAEQTVRADDPDASAAQVTGYWVQLVDANLDILVEPGNPDLLLVGQAVELPPLQT